MYAVIQSGGKQYTVRPGDTFNVEKLDGDAGTSVDLTDVLLVSDGEALNVGTPTVAGARVRAEIVEHGKGDKIIVFKYKSKIRYRKRTGHRQHYTRLRITEILT